MKILKPQLILALLLTLILSVQGVFGISISGSCGSSEWESGTDLNVDAPTSGTVDGIISLAEGITYPEISGTGSFDPTYTITDTTSGKKAEVYANVIGDAQTTWKWKVMLDSENKGMYVTAAPTGDGQTTITDDTSSYVYAYQSLTVSKANEISAYAAAWPASSSSTYDSNRMAKVSLIVSGVGNAYVTGLLQEARAIDTCGTASQSGVAGGDSIVSTAFSSKSPSNSYSLERKATGASALSFNDIATADTSIAGDLGYVAQMTTTPSGSVTVTDTRKKLDASGNAVEQKVTLGPTGFSTGSIISKNTGTIINDMVNSACTGSGATIKVASGKYNENIKIDKSLTLTGESSTSKPVIDGTGLTSGSLITVGNSNQAISVTLSNLELTGGTANFGAAIYNRATGTTLSTGESVPGLTLTDSYIHDNYAASGAGAGLLNEGSAYVKSTIFNKNVITSKGSQGGAILTAGDLTVKDCTITNNRAAYGSGIEICTGSNKKVEIIGGTISNNGYAAGTLCTTGGGIDVVQGAVATITGVTIQGNQATVGAGINNYGTITLNGDTISGNIATRGGGGIYNYYGSTVIAGASATTISGNTAPANAGGGVLNRGTIIGKANLICTSNTGGNWIGNAGT